MGRAVRYLPCTFPIDIVPGMKRLGGGRIINVSSTSGLRGPPLSTHYCASKGAATTFTKACATELRADNITVNAICPGPTATDMLVVYPGMADRVQEAAADTSSGPSRRIGRPDDIAGAAVFLASDEAAWISCALLVVDGEGTAS